MEFTSYDVALLTRGTGAFAYTYNGPAGLETGQVVAAPFRERIEPGIVIRRAATPDAARKLERLIPLECCESPDLGRLLLQLAQLSLAAPDEIAGHAVFAAAPESYCLHFVVSEPDVIDAQLLAALAKLKGKLGRAKRNGLTKILDWDSLATNVAIGAVSALLEISGAADQSRHNPRLKRWYTPDAATCGLLALATPAPPAMPGTYLSGFDHIVDFANWQVANRPEPGPVPAATDSLLKWEAARPDPDWNICTELPRLASHNLRRVQASWEELRTGGGLVDDLAADIVQNRNVLLVVPQDWMLERLWPALAPWATRCHRFHSDGGSGAAATILDAVNLRPGQLVAGGQSAWKLLLYGSFDRVVLVDPTHQQFQPERYPALDNRLALLVCAAAQETTVDLVETGLSVFDGSCPLPQLALLDPHEPDPDGMPPVGRIDTDPLPLELRQPGRRRLVYFNRLGSGRGLACAECRTSVACPGCGSRRIHFSQLTGEFVCPQCVYRARELRCPSCGLGNIAILAPGLEAVSRRSGDYLVHRDKSVRAAHSEHGSVFGMSELLEPLAQFWPQEIVYFHAESEPLIIEDWPRALDLAARLWSLYSNPDLQYSYLISSRLKTQLGESLTAAQIRQQWDSEMKLRRLASLPPYGRICRLAIGGKTKTLALAGKKQVGAFLQSHPDTAMLRIGNPYHEHRGFRIGGFFTNPELDYNNLMELRWRVHSCGARLYLSPMRGPWL